MVRLRLAKFVLPVFWCALRCQGLEADRMILQAGEFLVAVLQRSPELAWLRCRQHLARLALIGLAALSVARWLRSRMAAK